MSSVLESRLDSLCHGNWRQEQRCPWSRQEIDYLMADHRLGQEIERRLDEHPALRDRLDARAPLGDADLRAIDTVVLISRSAQTTTAAMMLHGESLRVEAARLHGEFYHHASWQPAAGEAMPQHEGWFDHDASEDWLRALGAYSRGLLAQKVTLDDRTPSWLSYRLMRCHSNQLRQDSRQRRRLAFVRPVIEGESIENTLTQIPDLDRAGQPECYLVDREALYDEAARAQGMQATFEALVAIYCGETRWGRARGKQLVAVRARALMYAGSRDLAAALDSHRFRAALETCRAGARPADRLGDRDAEAMLAALGAPTSGLAKNVDLFHNAMGTTDHAHLVAYSRLWLCGTAKRRDNPLARGPRRRKPAGAMGAAPGQLVAAVQATDAPEESLVA